MRVEKPCSYFLGIGLIEVQKPESGERGWYLINIIHSQSGGWLVYPITERPRKKPRFSICASLARYWNGTNWS